MGTVVSKKRNVELSDSTAVKIRYFQLADSISECTLLSQSCRGLS